MRVAHVVRPVIALAVTVPLLALSGPGTERALAVTCGPYTGGNYYAIAEWDNANSNQGAYADLYISSGHAADGGSGGHINQTLWENAYNAKYSGNYWVEGGYTYGYHSDNVLTYYWAQNSPSNGYHDHMVTSVTPSVGTWEPIEIQEVNGGSTWNIYYNWTIQQNRDGTSTIATSEPGYSEGMQTGLESTSTSNSMAGAYSSGLEYWTPSSGWSSSWGSSSYVTCDTGWVYWLSGQQDHEIEDGM